MVPLLSRFVIPDGGFVADFVDDFDAFRAVVSCDDRVLQAVSEGERQKSISMLSDE